MTDCGETTARKSAGRTRSRATSGSARRRGPPPALGRARRSPSRRAPSRPIRTGPIVSGPRRGAAGDPAARARGPVPTRRGEANSAASWLFAFVEDQPDRSGESRPTVLLDFQLFASRACQRVDLGVPAGVRRRPFGLHPPLLFQAVERRIQRALVDLNDGARDLLEALRDRVAVGRLER